jgi:hypothetical protein
MSPPENDWARLFVRRAAVHQHIPPRPGLIAA